MSGIGGLWSTLFEHWAVGLVVLALVSGAALLVLSGGRLLEALAGMLRVGLTFFTTPFLFLRDAVSIIRDSNEVEADYARSRAFMLFRYNRIQYLGVVVVALITLSGGVTAALLSLYPQAEVERGRVLEQQVEAMRGQLAEAQRAVSSAPSPDRRRALESQRAEAEAAYRTQSDSNAAFLANPPRRNGAIGQLATARSPEVVTELRGNIAEYMSGCPRGSNWTGYAPDDCARMRAYLNELAERRLSEFALAQSFNEADTAFQQASTAAQAAEGKLAGLRQDVAEIERERAAISLFNPSWIVAHLRDAITTLLSALLLIVMLVWFSAIVVDFINWLILLMRSAELSASEKVERAREDYQR